MNHADHVALLRPGVVPGAAWADLGSGRGAFTLALADLLGPDAEIHSIDRDPSALRDQAAEMRARFPSARVEYLTADFTGLLALPPLAGAVAANSLHFLPDPLPVLRTLHGLLVPRGRLVIVEYASERGNPWVPYPLPYRRWLELAGAAGFFEWESEPG